jgi:hypothetical protein
MLAASSHTEATEFSARSQLCAPDGNDGFMQMYLNKFPRKSQRQSSLVG